MGDALWLMFLLKAAAALVIFGSMAAIGAVVYQLRLRFGRGVAAAVFVGVWLIISVLMAIWSERDHIKHLGDIRYWVVYAVIVMVSMAPVTAFAMIVPRSISSDWKFWIGTVLVLVSVLAMPFVALTSVCALGVDCI
jgi:hypothetical protein